MPPHHALGEALQHYTKRSTAPLSDPARETPEWRTVERKKILAELHKRASQELLRRGDRKDEALPSHLLKEIFEVKVFFKFEVQFKSSPEMSKKAKAIIDMLEYTWKERGKAILAGHLPGTPPNPALSDLHRYYCFLVEKRADIDVLDGVGDILSTAVPSEEVLAPEHISPGCFVASCHPLMDDQHYRSRKGLRIPAGTPRERQQGELPSRPARLVLAGTKRKREGTNDCPKARHLRLEREELSADIRAWIEDYLKKRQPTGEPIPKPATPYKVPAPEDIVRDDLYRQLDSKEVQLRRFRYRTLDDYYIDRSPLYQVMLIDDPSTINIPDSSEPRAKRQRTHRKGLSGLSKFQITREYHAQLDANYKVYIKAKKRILQRMIRDLEKEADDEEEEDSSSSSESEYSWEDVDLDTVTVDVAKSLPHQKDEDV